MTFMSRRHANYDVFSAIADRTRRDILHRLGQGELPVTALADIFPTSLSAVSQHMRVLREAGLVRVRKAGRERFYRVNPEPLRAVAEWVKFYEPFWNNKLEALAAYLEAEEPQEPELEEPELEEQELEEEVEET